MAENLPSVPQWAAGLPPEITGNETARNILSQYPGADGEMKVEVPVGLIKSHIDTKRMIGGMVSVPAENATAEQVNAFNKRIGVPDTADGYEVKLPEGAPQGFFRDEEISAFKADAHALGIPKKKAEDLFGRFSGRQLTNFNKAMEGAKATVQQRIDVLKKEYGADYDATLQVADKAVNFANPEILEVLKQAGLLAHPAIVRGFAKIGKSLGEGVLKGIDLAPNNQPPMTQESLEVMMNDPRYKLPESDPVGKVWRQKVQDGFKQVYPGSATGDIMPSSGRSLHGA